MFKLLLIAEPAEEIVAHLSLWFELTVLIDSSRVLKILNEQQFDVLLYQLTHMNSKVLWLLNQILCYQPNLPIVILSETNDQNGTLKVIQMGVQDWICSSELNFPILKNRLWYAIERKHSQLMLWETYNTLERLFRKRMQENQHLTQKLQQEIQRRHSIEEALLTNRLFMENLISALQDGLVLINQHGMMLRVNPRFCTMVDYREEELIGLLPPFPYWSEQLQETGGNNFQNENFQGGEYLFKRKNGELFPALVSPGKMRDSQNNHLYFYLIKDLTEQKAIEQEAIQYREHLEELVLQRTRALERANQQLIEATLERQRAEASDRQHLQTLTHASRISMMGEMATEIAHELNQPLTAIRVYSEACLHLLTLNKSDDIAQALQEITQEAQRASGIIRDMRRLARNDDIQRSKIHVNELIQGIAHLIEMEAQWHEVPLRLRLALKLPWVFVNSLLIEQVIFNLARNAIEAMDAIPKRKRMLTIETTYNAIENSIETAIIDTGPGLSTQAIEQAFKSFFTTKPSGVGLGLSICQSIIKNHQGRLWALANTHHGTTFYFNLPIVSEREVIEENDNG